MMKVLFLDVDGVLNDASVPFGEVAEEYCERLDRIVWEARPLYVVLSSSWRKYADLRHEIADRFVISGTTPTLEREQIRGDEVIQWLQRHPRVSLHAILDDDPDFYPWQPLFNTPDSLTEEVADAVIAYFKEAGPP